MNDPYNAILDKLGDMQQDIGHLKGTTEAILEQAKKTNGRVTSHDTEIDELKGFKTKVTAYASLGAAAVTIFINYITRSI